MRAAVYRSYGPPEVIKLEERPQPSIGDDDRVLIRVHAASVNPLDIWLRQGVLFSRMTNGLAEPKKPHVPGVDVAGTVEAVGKNVTRFQVGDRVFGSCFGAHAEYVRPRERSLAHIPENVTFREAAAMPCVGLTALQALRDVAQVRPGHKVLIYGASGGIGHLAVQLARHFGAAEVTAVCSTANLPWVKELGADHVIDYSKADFAKAGTKYDVILDAVGKRTFFSCLPALTDTGVYVTENPMHPRWYQPFQLMISRVFGRRKGKTHIAKPTARDLEILARFMAEGRLRPVIERCYSLDEVVAAHRHAESGHTKGKVIIEVAT